MRLGRSRAADVQGATQPPAPEFAGVSRWLNVDGPMSLRALRGSVVLIEFWTLGCNNCVRTLPFMLEMDARSRRHGLVVIGVHTPEFWRETGTGVVRAASVRHGLSYAVGLDNAHATWNAYGVEFWPTMFVVNRHGAIARRHIGEGGYTQTERVINRLLPTPAPSLLDAA